jgi:hypothetical protein
MRNSVGQRVGIVPECPKILDVADKRRTWVPPLVWTFNWLLLRLM